MAGADLSKTYAGRGICAVRGRSRSDPQLIYRKLPCRDAPINHTAISRRNRSIPMMDVLMVALSFGWFALAIGYAYACERL